MPRWLRAVGCAPRAAGRRPRGLAAPAAARAGRAAGWPRRGRGRARAHRRAQPRAGLLAAIRTARSRPNWARARAPKGLPASTSCGGRTTGERGAAQKVGLGAGRLTGGRKSAAPREQSKDGATTPLEESSIRRGTRRALDWAASCARRGAQHDWRHASGGGGCEEEGTRPVGPAAGQGCHAAARVWGRRRRQDGPGGPRALGRPQGAGLRWLGARWATRELVS